VHKIKASGPSKGKVDANETFADAARTLCALISEQYTVAKEYEQLKKTVGWNIDNIASHACLCHEML
jgi:hypothetical protein